jgi:hypothetical protein
MSTPKAWPYHFCTGEGRMPLRQAQGKLSRQPAGPFDSAQGRLPALRMRIATSMIPLLTVSP